MIKRSFFIISSFTAFVANLLSITNTFRGSEVSYGKITFAIPSLEIGVLGSSHISFSLIFYLIFALSIINLKGSYTSLTIYSTIPLFLLMLWSCQFFQDSALVVLLVLYLFSIFRSFSLTMWFENESHYSSQILMEFYMSLNRSELNEADNQRLKNEKTRYSYLTIDHMSNLAKIFSVAVVPASALILINFGGFSPFWGWFNAIIASLCSYVIAELFGPSELQTASFLKLSGPIGTSNIS